MQTEIIQANGKQLALLTAEQLLIKDVQSALDLAMSVQYETGCRAMALYKGNITEDFFHLNTRLAGEVLQKFINYQIKVAIIGDFSSYTSQALHDFIYESNCGKDVFFASTREEAVARLTLALI